MYVHVLYVYRFILSSVDHVSDGSSLSHPQTVVSPSAPSLEEQKEVWSHYTHPPLPITIYLLLGDSSTVSRPLN